MHTTTMPRCLHTVLGLLAAGVLAGCGDASSTLGTATAPATSAKHAVASEPAARPDDDGSVPDGTTVFDDEFAAVSQLDPALGTALRTAAKAARRDGVTFVVNSGWRSPDYQERLLDRAIETYGSRAEAARWVATPETSPHVSGDAVDLGWAASQWLGQNGSRYGLCRIYANEPWHVELRPSAVADGCPPLYADPSVDPRMRR